MVNTMQPGKIIKIYEAVCGSCYRPEHAFHTKANFENELIDKGWKKAAVLGWLCNECAGSARVKRK